MSAPSSSANGPRRVYSKGIEVLEQLYTLAGIAAPEAPPAAASGAPSAVVPGPTTGAGRPDKRQRAKSLPTPQYALRSGPMAARPAATAASAADPCLTTPTGPSSEAALRRAAVRAMEKKSAGKRNGTGVKPPAWYRRDPLQHPERPYAWIKDWRTGQVRPRQKIDEMLDNMSEEKRERWLRNT